MPQQLHADFFPLVEKAVLEDGTIPIRIIAPGWGSSGYYSEEVLKRDIPKAFGAGTHMYWNHPTLEEDESRPERNLRDLAAVTVEAPMWQEEGAAGPGMYSRAKVFSPFAGAIDEMADHIGVSILGYGVQSEGEIDGRTGPVIEEITFGRSVDFVTAPGAGGAIVSVFEAVAGAARLPEPEEIEEQQESTEANQMSVEELQNQVGELEAELARRDSAIEGLRSRLLKTEAGDLVRAALAESALPETTRARLSRDLVRDLPIENDHLNADALGERIKTAIGEAQAELAEVAGSNGKIRGQGEANQAAGTGGKTLEETQARIDGALATIGYGGRRK